ncbi:hypothetical protein X559_2045 [Paenilisteria newyorkensis]|nr:hypothetical protein X559_2045 [Listeria newyorkensis]
MRRLISRLHILPELHSKTIRLHRKSIRFRILTRVQNPIIPRRNLRQILVPTRSNRHIRAIQTKRRHHILRHGFRRHNRACRLTRRPSLRAILHQRRIKILPFPRRVILKMHRLRKIKCLAFAYVLVHKGLRILRPIRNHLIHPCSRRILRQAIRHTRRLRLKQPQSIRIHSILIFYLRHVPRPRPILQLLLRLRIQIRHRHLTLRRQPFPIIIPKLALHTHRTLHKLPRHHRK